MDCISWVNRGAGGLLGMGTGLYSASFCGDDFLIMSMGVIGAAAGFGLGTTRTIILSALVVVAGLVIRA